MGKDGHIALKKLARHPGGGFLILAHEDMVIPEANRWMRANLSQCTGTQSSSEPLKLIGQCQPPGYNSVHCKKLTMDKVFPWFHMQRLHSPRTPTHPGYFTVARNVCLRHCVWRQAH